MDHWPSKSLTINLRYKQRSVAVSLGLQIILKSSKDVRVENMWELYFIDLLWFSKTYISGGSWKKAGVSLI